MGRAIKQQRLLSSSGKKGGCSVLTAMAQVAEPESALRERLSL